MKEMCCLSPDIYCTSVLYEGDAVLHAGRFQKAFKKTQTKPKGFEGISSKRSDWLLWEQRQEQKGKLACTKEKIPDVFNSYGLLLTFSCLCKVTKAGEKSIGILAAKEVSPPQIQLSQSQQVGRMQGGVMQVMSPAQSVLSHLWRGPLYGKGLKRNVMVSRA